MSRACAIVSFVAAAGFGVGVSCRRDSSPPSPPSPSPSAMSATDAAAPPSSSMTIASQNPTKTVAPCAVAYASYPSDAKDVPAPGDDLSSASIPFRVPAGATLTISARKTGHELTVQGPAVLRACTRDEPDVILLASGHASTSVASPIRPGSEIFIATPSIVAVVSRASLDLAVSSTKTEWMFDGGEAQMTTLDTWAAPKKGEKGSQKRFSDGGLLLTRCGVQATAAANAERWLAAMGTDAGPDAPPPLPSASIGILAAEEIKHARERVLDCAFAEAFALSCDELGKGGKAKEKAESGCKEGYAGVQAYLAKAVSATPLPPGSPAPPP